LNYAALIGRLTADPEIRMSAKNEPIANYTIAVDRPYDTHEVDFINCVAFGNNATFCQKYLRKGMKIACSGHIQTGKYKKADGTTVHTTQVVAERHEFVEKRSGGNSDPLPVKTGKSVGASGFETMDDDDTPLPF